MGGPEGILLVDKPSGWTSHDVVARVRRLAGQRRIGHTGTLDPSATGLLVLCLGRATRLAEYMSGHSKRYVGRIVLGATTDTDDAEGTVLARRPVPAIGDAQLRELERRFSGRLSQVPPQYSAVKVAGRRAHMEARQGRTVALAARVVTIERLALAPGGRDAIAVDVTCSAGTYVRSLARDIGEALGCGAHLAGLRRLAAGPFRVEAASTLAAIETACNSGRLDDLVLPADEGLVAMDVALVPRPEPVLVTPVRAIEGATRVRMYDASGAFLGVGEVDGGRLQPRKVLVSASVDITDSSQLG